MATAERLQKVLARAGIASRRNAEELITGGRVRVNGRIVTELGTRVDPRRDKVEVDGRRVFAEPLVYYVFHKPRSTVTTLEDPEGRATIAEYLKALPARVFPIGRLDFHTSGTLLLTNDGDLAQALLHPRRSVPKTYVAKVRGVPTDLQLEPMRTGVELEPAPGETPPVRTLPADVEVLRHAPSGEGARTDDGTTWLKITLREGRNRQIHRMAEAVGLFVMRLARIAFAGITTEGLRPGELRALTEKEVTALRATYLRPAEQAAGKPASADGQASAAFGGGRPARGGHPGARGERGGGHSGTRTERGARPAPRSARPDVDAARAPRVGATGHAPRGPAPRGPAPRGPAPRGAAPRGPAPRGPVPGGPGPRGTAPRGTGGERGERGWGAPDRAPRGNERGRGPAARGGAAGGPPRGGDAPRDARAKVASPGRVRRAEGAGPRDRSGRGGGGRGEGGGTRGGRRRG